MKKCTSFEEWKERRYIWGNIYFHIIAFSCLSSTNSCLRFILICFAQEIKGFYRFPVEMKLISWSLCKFFKTLAQNLNFKKLRRSFGDESTMITRALKSSCHWKPLAPFCLWKKRPGNKFLTLTLSYHKIIEKGNLCHSKQL